MGKFHSTCEACGHTQDLEVVRGGLALDIDQSTMWTVTPGPVQDVPHKLAIFGPKDGDKTTPFKIDCDFPNSYGRTEIKAELLAMLDQYFGG